MLRAEAVATVNSRFELTVGLSKVKAHGHPDLIGTDRGYPLFGVLNLVYTTSNILHNPEADSPIAGALMLFAGLFNVFVAALDILLRSTASDE